MLSTLTIVSIFTEIFATGILFSGAFAFARRYFAEHEKKDIYLSAVFLSFSVYVALTVVSQMLYNFGKPLNELIAVNKAVHISITLCSLLLWFFIRDKFGFASSKLAGFFTFVLTALSLIAAIDIIASRVDLVFRSDVIEPIANFSLFSPSKGLWVLMWIVLASLSAVNLFGAPVQKRNLLFLTGLSALMVVMAHIATAAYLATADASFLLSSWVIILFAAMGFLIGETISPSSKLALEPLNLFRTRVLYKLILIFVLLIVILFEATTLVTINISRDSLVTAIRKNQLSVALSIADRISYRGIKQRGTFDLDLIRELVINATSGKRVVYVVDKSGKVLVHPQISHVGKNLRGVASVDEVLKGNSGSADYSSPMFIVPDDAVVGSFTPVKGTTLGVVVEEPKAYAYTEIRKVETNSLIFIIAGIMLTIVVGVFFARSIERPIKEVIAGTIEVRRGNLSHQIAINSVDEIGELAQAFNQMTSELRDTQEHLVASEKLASLGTMAAGMAHEIKNPLVSLRTFTQLLQQKFDDPEYRRKFSAIVPQEIERINRIAESLLKFGRPSKPELAKVSVNKGLEEVLDLMDNECRSNNIRVTTKLAQIPEITGDAMQLSQAFVNIILNAIQAMPKGGELTVKTDVGEVIRLSKGMRKGVLKKEEASFGERIWGKAAEEEVTQGGNEKPVPVVFVEITDTGDGISEENLKSLFDPFFTTKAGGTGMGLPITLRIIEDHNGSVKVKSQAGAGTTFIVTLPLTQERSQALSENVVDQERKGFFHSGA
jgi:signal transduction histidine kinase